MRPALRLPVPLPGGKGATAGEASDVRPIAQWVEPASSGAGMPATVVPMTMPGFYYQPTTAVGSLTSLWLRRESGTTSEAITATLYIDSVDSGHSVSILSGDNEGSGPLGVDVSAGADIRIVLDGGNDAVVSGVLRTPTRLFRLASAPLGKFWVLEDGTWMAPTTLYVLDGTWVEADGGYRLDGTWAGFI